MGDERDLGAMLQRVLAQVLTRERVVLAAHDLPMWDYVALVRLGDQVARTQADLAVAMRRDKTRVIESVDRLEHRGLITRQPDPNDRRKRIIALTPRGERVLAASRRDVRAMERDLLEVVPATQRRAFLAALRALDDRYGSQG